VKWNLSLPTVLSHQPSAGAGYLNRLADVKENFRLRGIVRGTTSLVTTEGVY